jgi:putative addiction module component (TIGR02574 family)
MSANIKVPPEFDAVSSDEQIEFVQELWDRIARNPDRIEVPEEHRRILDERLGEYEKHKRSGRPWGEVREELLTKLRR